MHGRWCRSSRARRRGRGGGGGRGPPRGAHPPPPPGPGGAPTPGARFCAVGAAIGLVPVGGQLSRLLELVGYPVAYRWLATAAPFTAAEAERHGFVTEIHDDAVGRAVEIARAIASVSPSVVAAVKVGLTHSLRHGPEAGRAAEPRLAAVVRELPDGAEGVRAFFDRRPPRYPDRPADLRERLTEGVQ